MTSPDGAATPATEPPTSTARWRAPGRINLIGEHTDYNAGFVLPFAIDASCTAAVTPTDSSALRAHSAQRGDTVETSLDRLRPGADEGWAAYALGALWVLRRDGYRVTGVAIDLDSDVPVGAGLSSSAALVCSVVTAVDDLHGLGLSAAELLATTRAVENDYVGAPTGGMDQLAALRCTAGHALFCDMRSLASEQVPLPLAEAGLTILVVDTRAEHAHADGEYRRRREACERAAELLGVPALRDVGLADLDAALTRLDDDELVRATRHVVTENDRVVRTAELLRAGLVGEIGPLLTESHASMRDDYRITIPELDVAVDTLVAAGARGARMTGGGFGGCVIALISPADVPGAVAAVEREYDTRGFREPSHFTVDQAGPGAHRVVTT